MNMKQLGLSLLITMALTAFSGEILAKKPPVAKLVQVEGTPLDGSDAFDPIDFVRTIAVARIIMPASHVRLSAGREEMSDETQALCFLAGANSIFYGEKLLTTANPEENKDMALFKKLGIEPMPARH